MAVYVRITENLRIYYKESILLPWLYGSAGYYII